ncbi:MAG: sigma-54-dependent Fis family transcriptional regulator [Candidatus Schekmanbacteria bacterium]|nr:sigma-54-dependent Fis family transcriptional regulator [Candidatus Schekmanbacteria bacterium]
MSDQPAILVVDDEKNILTALARALSLDGYAVVTAASGEEALRVVEERSVDLVMLDVKLPGMDGLEVLGLLRSRSPDTPVVMMSGHGTIETAVRATRLGAFDFIEKPINVERILVAVSNALQLGRLRRENVDLRRQIEARYHLVGDSRPMRELRDRIATTAQTNGRVLIRGENGTGKELVARQIHQLSKRRTGPFVRMNCAAVPNELIESVLFGHEKGSFTGATETRRGKFEQANKGTLFLDEIGDMGVQMQSKLLRVLQEGELERVGGSEMISVDVRVISATNKNLEDEIRHGRFREDLYYRINVIPLTVPPLRDRRDDISLLCDHFLRSASDEHGRKMPRLAVDGAQALCAYSWPGNVRELANIIDRLVILGPSDVIDAAAVAQVLPLQALEPACAEMPDTAGGDELPLRERVRMLERELIERELGRHSWNISSAARSLGLERSHLYKKMANLGIGRND